MKHQYIDIDGVKLHYVAATPPQPRGTIIFLHGFPEYWASWHHQIEYFSQGFRVIAPDLPGYNLSDKPLDSSFYQLPKLIAFMARFVEEVCQAHRQDEPVYLVAHDWGGAIAWPLVAFYPQLFTKLIIINAAHPSTFTREMFINPRQQQKSHYIHQLTAKDGPAQVKKNDFEFLREMVFAGTTYAVFNEEEKSNYLAAWQQPQAVEGMLAYYRMMPQHPPLIRESDGLAALQSVKIPNIRITIPTLVLWGEQDEAFENAILNGLEDYVPDLAIKRFADASHWLHHEQPENVNKHIAAFICLVP
ncbi:alpha/beta fold hydrolase [Flavobacterium sp. W21_SRS_FM6]|uniref:alpha/beta fold hydrolase n=1 Tax=Flavobacterium sp. W21_SRS_FM6 TaxID=3240268 RepID=UPI003F8F1686